MAMAVCRCNIKHIAQCRMSRVILEATGCCYRATTYSILPQQVPGQQQKTTAKTHTYFAGHFDGHGDVPVCYHAHRPMEEVQGFTKKATGCHHWVSFMSNNIKQTYLHQFLLMVFIVNMLKMGAKQKDGPN